MISGCLTRKHLPHYTIELDLHGPWTPVFVMRWTGPDPLSGACGGGDEDRRNQDWNHNVNQEKHWKADLRGTPGLLLRRQKRGGLAGFWRRPSLSLTLTHTQTQKH